MKPLTYEINFAENLEFMSTLESETIDFIYIDPPFNTSKVQKKTKIKPKNWAELVVDLEFYDSFGTGTSGYVQFMRPRLEHCHRLLKTTGVLCVHLDYNSVHYIKCLLDEIFGYGDIDIGKNRFLNEIIWRRGAGNSNTKANKFHRNHDTILVYSKQKIKKFTRQFKPYSEKTLKKYKFDDDDGRGKYRLQGLRTYGKDKIEEFRKDNRIVKSSTGKLYFKQYLSEKPGVTMDSIWDDISGMGHKASEEYLEYPTQKPVALVKRLIESFTIKGDLVADFFCGCATTLEAAMTLDRSFIGCDGQDKVLSVLKERLEKRKVEMTKYPIEAKDPYSQIPKDFDKMDWQTYERKSILCAGGVPNANQSSDGGCDGIRINDGALIQAKKQETKTGRPDLQKFVGAMVLRRKKKGVFISHSGYSNQARTFVSDIRKDGYIIELETSSYLQKKAKLREKEIKSFNKKFKSKDQLKFKFDTIKNVKKAA